MEIFTETQVALRRTAVTLNGQPNFTVAVRYEPAQRSLRVMYAGEQRLFFFQPDPFFRSRGSLLNEYGLVEGKLQFRYGKGFVQLYQQRILIRQQAAQGLLMLQPADPMQSLRWYYGTNNGALDAKAPELFRALLLLLARYAAVPALQH